jgi:hypothetical protein
VHVTWAANCHETRTHGDEVAQARTRYTFDEALRVKSLQNPQFSGGWLPF